MGRVGLLVLLSLASCYTSGSPPPATRPPPSPVPQVSEPQEPAPPSGGFAQPPPQGTSSRPPPATPPTPLAGLPTTGPECQRGCPDTAPAHPTMQCRDGIHTGGRGPCVRFSSGCNWSGLVCPAAQPRIQCKPSDCDLPIPSEWLCPDGTSVGRFTCVASEQGRCGATYQACPFFRPPPKPQPQPQPKPQPQRSCNPLPSDRELATWEIGEMCSPGGGPDPGDVRPIKDLPDGTHIVNNNGRCMRVRYRRCFTKCLPPEARIATPSGDVRIDTLRVGSEIWSQDARGRRVAARIEQLGSIDITSEHHVAHIVLADGRALTVSPQHPVLDGHVVQDLHAGEAYDGSTIVTLDFIRYAGARTFDLLPAGATGVYWAEGIPLRSTMVRAPHIRKTVP